MRQMVIMIAVVVLLLSVGSTAQEARSEVSLQGTGLFTKDTTVRDSAQRGTENGGFSSATGIISTAGSLRKVCMVTAATRNSILRPQGSPGFRPTFIRRPAAW